MADRNIMSIEISPAAQQALDRVCDVTRLGKKVVVEGVLEWLAQQHPDHQVVIGGRFSQEMKAAVARSILEKTAGVPQSAPHFDADQLIKNMPAPNSDAASGKSPPSGGGGSPARPRGKGAK